MTLEMEMPPARAAGAGMAMLAMDEHDSSLAPHDNITTSDSSAEGFEIEWPSDYRLDEEGLWFDGGSPERISGPFKVLGEARNAESTGWGIALEWRDRDRVNHCAVVSRSDLIGGPDVMRALVDGGLELSTKPSSLNRFREALNGVRCSGRVRLVEKTGWHGSAFVLRIG
jgi:hypothetical protein